MIELLISTFIINCALAASPAKMVVYNGFLTVVSEKAKNAPLSWEYIERSPQNGDSVAIIASTKKSEIIFVEQYRVPQHARVLDIPGGTIPKKHSISEILKAAQKELFEEADFKTGLKDMKLVNEAPANARITSERNFLVRAKNIVSTPEPDIDQGQGENWQKFKFFSIPFEKVPEFIESRKKEGVLVDHKVYSALYFISKEKS